MSLSESATRCLNKALKLDISLLSYNSLSYKLNLLSPQVMADIFLELLPLSDYTRNSFARAWRINSGNFTTWTKKEKNSTASFFAVKDWLLSLVKKREQEIRKEEEFTFPELYSFINSSSLEKIIVIDYDSFPFLLSSKNKLCSLASSLGVLFICIFSQAKTEDYVKLAAELAITFYSPNVEIKTSSLLSLLAVYFQEKSLFFLSKSPLAEEIIEGAKQVSPKVLLINKEIDLLNLLSDYIESRS